MAVYANKIAISPGYGDPDIKMLIADFPFDYGNYLAQSSSSGIGEVPPDKLGTPVAVIGGGVAGLVAAFELMRIGLKPVVYEVSDFTLGGRFNSQIFPVGDSQIPFAEMGAMRFPPSATALFHYIDLLGLQTEPFPNPLTEAAYSTLIDLRGQTYYVEGTGPVPDRFARIADKWHAALQTYFEFDEMQAAIKQGDTDAIKSIWNERVAKYDDVSFHRFLVDAGFTYDDIYTFGQVGFGSGGWNTDYPNSILEILRVVYTNADDNHQRLVSGTTSFIRGLWELAPANMKHWPQGTSLKSLNGGVPAGEVKVMVHNGEQIVVSTEDGPTSFDAVIITPEKRVLQSGKIVLDNSLFGENVISAMHNTHYELSGKVFCQASAPIWTEKNLSGRYRMSMTLSDRLTRGTYLFDESGGVPVVCLSYTWNDDTLKFLPFSTDEQFFRCSLVLQELYPNESMGELFIGEPLSIIWDDEPRFIGAFKNNLPGDYRIQRELFTAFKEDTVSIAKGAFLAGDDVSWTGGWSEGAIHTGLNAAWGVMNHLGGSSFGTNPGPGDDGIYEKIAPVTLPE